MTHRTLTAFYDFSICPVTYDFTVFAALAEMTRRRKGCVQTRFVIVPGDKDGFRNDDVTYSNDNKVWRLRNIVLPSCWLFDRSASVTVCASRDEAAAIESAVTGPIFPLGYSTHVPVGNYLWSGVSAALACGETLPQARPSGEASAIVSTWLSERANGRRPISITLRESTHAPVRNSNRQAWLDFVQSLNPSKYFAIAVPDTEKAFALSSDTGEGPISWVAPSLNLEIRLALFEQCWLNLMVTNGPGVLCWLSPTPRFLMFKMLADWDNASAAYHASVGLDVGKQLPHATPFQRLVWEPDNLDVIEREFQAMVARIEAAPEAEPPAPDPSNAEDPMAIAVRLQTMGRLEEATTIYQEIVARDPDNADAWHLLGIIAHQADRADAAEKMILRAIALKPGQANYYINLAAVLRKAGRHEEAANSLWRAIALSPNDAGAHADLAGLLQILGANNEARSAVLKAIQLSPKSPSLCERAARVLQELGHADEAASLYRRAIDLRDEARAAHTRRLPEVPSVSLSTG
jgi:tetratricopeptide (TPR) repeat protein